jgi:adenosylmethionine-8-amino-7-oxononanoate aminotransferase
LPAWRVAEFRQTGMILAIELVKDKAHRVLTPGRSAASASSIIHGLSRGVLLRPLGDVIYFMPPYVITEDEIRLMAEVATEGIERATAQ